jgi:putative membrane protein
VTLAAAFPAFHAHSEVVVIVGLVAMGYGLLVRRGAREGLVTTPAQQRLFYGGVAVMFVAASWPMHDLAERYLFSVHMVQHTVISLVIPPLLLQGTPAWMARRVLGRSVGVVRQLARPLPALVIFNTYIVVSHIPAVVDFQLTNEPGHFVLHTTLFLTASLMWMPVLSPLPEIRRLAPLAQMVYLFLQSIVPTVPASFLPLSDSLLYPRYATFPRMWGMSAIQDQRVAGLIMKLVGGLILWAFIAVVWFKWANREQSADRSARRLGIDRMPDDAGVLTWADVEAELERVGPPPAAPTNPTSSA